MRPTGPHTTAAAEADAAAVEVTVRASTADWERSSVEDRIEGGHAGGGETMPSRLIRQSHLHYDGD